MGDIGPAHQAATFSGCADDLHTGGIIKVIHTRDRLDTWSVSLYRIIPGPQVYSSLLEEFPKSHGNTVDNEHCFSSTDTQPIGEDHTGFGRHATGMHPRSQGWLGRAFSLGRVRL